jgi:signal transduction histidine kinase/CheY-like chemotaxis protein
MHKLLETQLRRLGGPAAIPEELRPLLETVSATYAESDADRVLLERSLDLTSQELLARNAELRARSEAALAASERLLSEAQAQAHLGSWRCDPRTHEAAWSDEQFRIFGLAPGGKPPDCVAWAQHAHPDDRARRQAEIDRALADGTSYAIEYRVVRPDGAVRWVAESARVETDAAGAAVQLFGTCQDITERRSKDEAIHAALGASEKANRAKTEFLANMSHEIRTPLNAIIGIADLLDGRDLTAEQAAHVDTIRASGEHLLGIINEVLDFSKLQAGRLELDVTPLELHPLAMQCLDAVRPAAEKKGLKLAFTVASDVPQRVWGDGGRIRQILLNLLSNAVKFTAQGGVTLAFANRSVHEGRHEIEITVRDTGIGIPADRFDRLFQPFSQVDGSITRAYGGTGLGLALSKRLAEAMDGRIAVASEEGQGSTFQVRLPLKVVDTVTAPAPHDEAVQLTAGLRVLVAEDNTINQQVALSMLRRLQCEADVVGDGERAVAAVARKGYDVVLMDLQMPVMDGLEAARRIRALAGGAGRPAPCLVALTAHAQPGDREACLAAGMDDYIAKPVRLAALGAALARSRRSAASA